MSNAERQPENVPYIVYESSMARAERHSRRLIIALVISIVFVALSNFAWLWAWMQYDYTSEETSYDYSQDGQGVNIIGDNNGVNDEPTLESYNPQADAD